MTRTERYEILETLQQGHFAASYRAHDRVLDRPVLLKVLHPRLQADAELVQRFRREALLQARLKHPGIVTVYDFGGEEEFYIASEFVSGRTLEALLKERGRLTPEALVPLLLPVVRALRYAHERGVIHRDLKPANILIPNRGEPKLADFGLACARDFGPLTIEGCVIGTPAYMSPEQARGQATDTRTDIFSLGVVLYEALTGQNPFAAPSHAEALSRVLGHRTADIRSIRPELPVDLGALIGRMLAKEPDARPADLAPVEAMLSGGDGRAVPPETRRRPVRMRKLVLTGTLALAAIIAATLVLLLSSLPRREQARTVPPQGNRAETADPVPAAAPAGTPDTAHAEDRTPVPEQARADVPAITMSSLTVHVTPWAEVLLNGRSLGVTPSVRDLPVARGNYRLTLRNPYYPEIERAVSITEPVSHLRFDLEAEFALLDLIVEPWAVVSIDGAIRDTTPLARPIPVPPGEHLITLSHPELGIKVKSIRVESTGRYRFSFDLAQQE